MNLKRKLEDAVTRRAKERERESIVSLNERANSALGTLFDLLLADYYLNTVERRLSEVIGGLIRSDNLSGTNL